MSLVIWWWLLTIFCICFWMRQRKIDLNLTLLSRYHRSSWMLDLASRRCCKLWRRRSGGARWWVIFGIVKLRRLIDSNFSRRIIGRNLLIILVNWWLINFDILSFIYQIESFTPPHFISFYSLSCHPEAVVPGHILLRKRRRGKERVVLEATPPDPTPHEDLLTQNLRRRGGISRRRHKKLSRLLNFLSPISIRR